MVSGNGIDKLIDDFIGTVLFVPFCPYHFVHTILSNDILSVYHFVRYHFVRYQRRPLGSHINADIRLGGNSTCVPVSHVNFFAEGTKVYSQTGWGSWKNFPLPWICHCLILCRYRKNPVSVSCSTPIALYTVGGDNYDAATHTLIYRGKENKAAKTLYPRLLHGDL